MDDITPRNVFQVLGRHLNEHRWREGIIYFVVAADPACHIKIGWSRSNPAERLNKLQSGNPYPLWLAGYLPGSQKREAELHEHFADRRVGREWFAPDRELLEELEWSHPDPQVFEPSDDPEWSVSSDDCEMCQALLQFSSLE